MNEDSSYSLKCSSIYMSGDFYILVSSSYAQTLTLGTSGTKIEFGEIVRFPV